MIKELIHARIFFPLGKAEVTTKEDLLCPNFCQTMELKQIRTLTYM